MKLSYFSILVEVLHELWRLSFLISFLGNTASLICQFLWRLLMELLLRKILLEQKELIVLLLRDCEGGMCKWSCIWLRHAWCYFKDAFLLLYLLCYVVLIGMAWFNYTDLLQTLPVKLMRLINQRQSSWMLRHRHTLKSIGFFAPSNHDLNMDIFVLLEVLFVSKLCYSFLFQQTAPRKFNRWNGWVSKTAQGE